MSEQAKIIRRRILMVIPELGFGGAEKSFLHLAQLLSEFHDVSLVVFKRHYAKGNYSKKEEDISLPLIVLDSGVDSGRLGRWHNRLSKLRALKNDADLTISFLTGANILNVVSGGQGSKVVSMRGSRRYDPAFSRLRLLLYEHFVDPLTFKYSDSIIAISEGLSGELRRNVGVATQTKIKTIQLFIDAKQLINSSNDIIEEQISELIAYPVIVAAGRLSPEKGFQNLLHVFAIVRKSVPGAKFLLIGDGPLYKYLKELCEILNLPVSDGKSNVLESAVIFLGYCNNPNRYFRVARLFVMSSIAEGFSNVLLEALAAGIPVIAVNCPWGPRSILWKEPDDVITPYPTVTPTYADYGVLMPRIDQARFHHIWADELVKLLNQPSLVEKYAERGPQRVREFDSQLIVHKWLDVIEELCR